MHTSGTVIERRMRPEVKDLRRQRSVAVIGYGSIGRRHCENLGQLGVESRLVVRRRQSANSAFTPPSDVRVLHDLQDVLAARPDLAIICTPTRQHVETALPLLSAGIAVLIEKPVAADAAAARQLQAAAEHHGTFCSVAYCMRYHGAYRAAREAILSGRLGAVLYAKAWFESYLPQWHPWEDYRHSYAARRDLGGGVLPTLDHELDFLNWCLGQPLRVHGTSHRSGALEIDVDDTASLVLQYANGATAMCQLSLCRRDRQRGFEFVGTQASLRYSLAGGQLVLDRGDGSTPDVLWDGSNDDLNQMYLDMLADCLDALETGRPPVPLEAGIAALEICECVNSTSPAQP